jgi:hypothetical protein
VVWNFRRRHLPIFYWCFFLLPDFDVSSDFYPRLSYFVLSLKCSQWTLHKQCKQTSRWKCQINIHAGTALIVKYFSTSSITSWISHRIEIWHEKHLLLCYLQQFAFVFNMFKISATLAICKQKFRYCQDEHSVLYILNVCGIDDQEDVIEICIWSHQKE